MMKMRTTLMLLSIIALSASTTSSQNAPDFGARLQRLADTFTQARQAIEEKFRARVAVKVRRSGEQNLANNSRVMYDVEISNVGNAFDLKHGEFVAPFSGIYILGAQACTAGMQWMELDVVRAHGGTTHTTVGKMFVEQDRFQSCASETVSLHLVKGDKIWVQRVAGSTTVLKQDHGWNSFTATLVMTD